MQGRDFLDKEIHRNRGKGTGKQGERGHIRMITKSRDIFHLATLFDALWRKAAFLLIESSVQVIEIFKHSITL